MVFLQDGKAVQDGIQPFSPPALRKGFDLATKAREQEAAAGPTTSVQCVRERAHFHRCSRVTVDEQGGGVTTFEEEIFMI